MTARLHRRATALVTTLAAMAVGAAVIAPVAVAEDAPFYTPPTGLSPGHDGDVIRLQETTFYLDPVRAVPADARARRIMYHSRDHNNHPTAVTGTVLTPRTAWREPGPRPVVAYTVGTRGQGDQCAPSRNRAPGLEYEGPFIAGLLQRGWGVVITDYQGLGTPGVHTYANRTATGHAVLDALRAAQRLPVDDLPAHGPVAIGGYSQGGGAAAAAAELAAGYAPDLHIVGAYAGAPPADKAAVAEFMDGKYTMAALGYAVNSLDAAYPELKLRSHFNGRGQQLLDQVAHECLAPESILKHAFVPTTSLTADGRSLAAHTREGALATRVAEQRLGGTPPAFPVMVAHAPGDDLLPYPQARQLGLDWCARGAGVTFQRLITPTHLGALAESASRMRSWLADRLAGKPAPTDCGQF